jgi:hypothetical protein
MGLQETGDLQVPESFRERSISAMRCKWQLLSVFLLSANLLALAQATSPFFSDDANGMIAGTVLDGTGQVADHARVCVSVTSGNITSGTTTNINCAASTDKYGQFQIEHLKIGDYAVFARDSRDEPSIDDQQGQKVTLTAAAPYAHVTIRLKPGGILLGSVTDASSGKPVEQFQVQYQELDEQGAGTAFANHGRFRLVVPVATDLVIIVTAPGYRGWVYTDSDNPSRPVLRVASGEQKELDIELQPLPAGAVQGTPSRASSH